MSKRKLTNDREGEVGGRRSIGYARCRGRSFAHAWIAHRGRIAFSDAVPTWNKNYLCNVNKVISCA